MCVKKEEYLCLLTLFNCFKGWDNECYLLFKIDFPSFSNNSISNILTGMGVYFYLPQYPEMPKRHSTLGINRYSMKMCSISR